MAAYAPQDDEPEELIGRHAVPVVVDHVQRRLLHAGRILVTGGWLVLTYTIGNGAAANAEHALVGLALLLLGVFLITMSPVVNQFPGVIAVADAALFYSLEEA